ncbi:MAG TPA: T9SS type A sorting domain-containing protein [Lentimicrobium sp.]|nr:T9SS type A sorting domain-containing protein [Lentimicrobium sp.]
MNTRFYYYTHFFNRKPWLVSLILVSFSLTTFSQKNTYNNHPAFNAKDYVRTELFSGNRTDANGSMRSYVIASETAKDSIRKILSARQHLNNRNSYRPVQFYPLGPSKTTDSVLSRLGLVSALWVDTSNYQTIYAGSNTGGIFATYDGGQNWISLTDNYLTTGVLAIEVDPKNKQHIYIGTGHWGFSREWGEGIMQSFDGGQTWQNTSLTANSIEQGFVVQDLKYLDTKPDTLIAVINREFSQGTSIYRSIDKGNTWHEVFSKEGEELFDIVKSPVDPDLIYAVGSLYLKSTDGGLTWQDLTTEIALNRYHKISRLALTISKEPPFDMLAFLESYDTVTPGNYDHWLLRNHGDGSHFQNIKIKYIPYVGYWKMELQFSPTDPDQFYLGGIWFFKYRLEGDSAHYIDYRNHRYHKDVRELLVFEGDSSDIVFMGNDGGVTRSDNGTEVWYDITRSGMQSTQFYNLAISDKSNMVFCGPQDGNLCFYNYDTGEWTKEAHIGDAYDGLVDYNDARNVYLVTYPPKLNRKNIFLLKSNDGGVTFNYKGVPDTTEQGRNNIPVAMDAVNPKILYAGLKNVWKSIDGAETWQKISNFRPDNTHKIQALEVSPSHPGVICVSFENPAWGETDLEKIMITTNGGQKWTDITPRGALNLRWVSCVDILIHPDNPAVIYLALDRMWANNRVYVTHDGGRTWENFSEGLPNLPVNALKYYKGAGYDIFFAATDAGVFYRDALMTRWEFFSEGLPLTIVSDLDINYKRKKLVVSTFGRGLWETDICLPLEEEKVISGTVNWPEGKNLLSDLILMPDSKLTMTGKIEVGEGRKIKVMPGAELILNQATLTNNCLTLWQGIQLFGNNDYSSDNPQGKITMLYGSVIENAFRGIETYSMDKDGNVDSLKGGGIIYSNQANFRNILQPVVLKPTKGVNPSKFILTEFSLKEPPWQGEEFSEFVSMDNNMGIDFVNCIFRNDIPYSILPAKDRGIGINAYNSSFRIYNSKADSVVIGPSTKPLFYQLYKGVNATTATPGYSFYSKGVTYKNNITGAYLSGYSSIGAVDNAFEIKPLVYENPVPKIITGLYLDNTTIYQVNNNIFKSFPSFGINANLAGLVLNNTGELNNLVSANRFEKLTYAVLVQNKNKSDDGSNGLRLLFNSFIKNDYGIAITHDTLGNISGIAYYQGVPGNYIMEPAGNRFGNNKVQKTGDFHNEGITVIYSHYLDNYKTGGQVPLMSGNIRLLGSAFTLQGDSTYLPPYLEVDTANIGEIKTNWKKNYITYLSNYVAVADGGNTPGLINEIKSLTQNSTPFLYEKLRKLDSKLSSECLAELIKNNNFPNTLLIEILVRNPGVLRDTAILQSILDRNPVMPDYMLQRLNGLSDRYSTAELLKISSNNSKAIFEGMLAIELNKSWMEHPGQIAAKSGEILQDWEEIPIQVTKAFIQHTSGNEEEASWQLNKAIELHPDQKSSLANLSALMQLDDSLTENPQDSLSMAQKELLSSISDAFTSIYVSNIKEHFIKGSYNEPYITPSYIPVLPYHNFPNEGVTGSGFRFYPQPASDYLIVDFYYESGFEKGTLEFTNSSGQIVRNVPITGKAGQEFLNVSNWTPGLYLVRLLNNNEVIEFRKLLIIR